MPPRGLSGAPLVHAREGVAQVSGIVLQHYTNEFGGITTQLGIALDAEELLTLRSRVLDGSVAELVFHRPAIPPRDKRP